MPEIFRIHSCSHFLQGRHRIRPRRSPSPLHSQPLPLADYPGDPGGVFTIFPFPVMKAQGGNARDIRTGVEGNRALQAAHRMTRRTLPWTITAGTGSRIQGGDEGRHVQKTGQLALSAQCLRLTLSFWDSRVAAQRLFPPFTDGRLRRQNSGLVLEVGSRDLDEGPCANQGSPSRARILFPGAQAAGPHDHAERQRAVPWMT